MKATGTWSFAAVAFTAALLASCDKPKEPEAPKDMPTVNDENCKSQIIAKLDLSIREKFSSACLRRGSFQPSEQKSW